MRIKQRTEPWITPDIIKCLNDRDSAFHLYRKHKTEENFVNFKSLRNKANDCIF